MTTTNDAMYISLKAMYPAAGDSLGDLLYAYWSAEGLGFRGSLQFDYYVAQQSVSEATGTTWGDLANSFWSDPDFVVSNLENESGNDLLLEDGSFVLLEVGNG
jgi:hypothetical protein